MLLNASTISLLGLAFEDSFSLDFTSPILRLIIIIFLICCCFFPFKYLFDLLRGK